MRIRNLSARLKKDCKGSTAVEFALLALPFFVLIFGVLQLGILFLANQGLNEALNNASRSILIGQQQASSFNDFRTAVCDNAALVLVTNCENNIQLSVQSFADTSSINQAALFDSDGHPIIVNGTFFPGSSDSVVVVSASINLPIVGGALMPGFDGNTQLLSSSLAFKNESFVTLPAGSSPGGSLIGSAAGTSGGGSGS